MKLLAFNESELV